MCFLRLSHLTCFPYHATKSFSASCFLYALYGMAMCFLFSAFSINGREAIRCDATSRWQGDFRFFGNGDGYSTIAWNFDSFLTLTRWFDWVLIFESEEEALMRRIEGVSGVRLKKFINLISDSPVFSYKIKLSDFSPPKTPLERQSREANYDPITPPVINDILAFLFFELLAHISISLNIHFYNSISSRSGDIWPERIFLVVIYFMYDTSEGFSLHLSLNGSIVSLPQPKGS